MNHIALDIFTHEQKRNLKAKILSRVDISPRGCWLWKKWRAASYGYGMMDLRFIGKHHKIRVHRLTYFLWKKDPAELEVLHHCDITHCCNPMHLFLGTQTENMTDMRNKGRDCSPPTFLGVDHPNSKLSDEEVLQMRELREQGYTYPDIGKIYGVGATTVHYCVNNGWKHLEKSSLQTRKEND